MEAVSTAFDYWSPAMVESSIEDAVYSEYSPAATWTRGTPIEFIIPGVHRQYLDLWRSYLYIKAKITLANGNDIPDDAAVGPVNLFLHALFSNVEVQLGNKVVTNQDGLYPLRAYVETLLNYSSEVRDTQLQAALWYKDTADHMNDTDDHNHGFARRAAYVAGSAEVEMLGRPHVDIFHQERPIIGDCSLRIKLQTSNDAFVLMTPGPDTHEAQVPYRVQLTTVKFFIKTLKVSNTLVLAHEETLRKHNALFPIRQVIMKHLTIPQGQNNVRHDNLFLGQLPRRLVLGMVCDQALTGHYQQNPFNFRHFGMRQIALYVNGDCVPSRPYEPDFAREHYLREYMSIFEGTGTLFTDKTVPVSRDDYPRGYTLLVFNLAGAVENTCGGALCKSSTKTGTIRLEVKFAAPTPETIDIVCLAEFDAVIEIDKNRYVSLSPA